MLTILGLPVGPLQTNAWLIAEEGGEAVIVDPGWEGERLWQEAQRRRWRIRQVWCTHAHFDHIGGIPDLVRRRQGALLLALHADDHPLWYLQGGASLFGFSLPPLPSPTLTLHDGQSLTLGRYTFQVRHTPGHTPGHCVFYCKEAAACFCGDLIFRASVGRTDLPGGSWEALERSIRTQILTLPDETRLFPGHGPETTVGEEKASNPFISP